MLAFNPIIDGITDPIMTQITDDTDTRWGRRPWILMGGVTRQI